MEGSLFASSTPHCSVSRVLCECALLAHASPHDVQLLVVLTAERALRVCSMENEWQQAVVTTSDGEGSRHKEAHGSTSNASGLHVRKRRLAPAFSARGSQQPTGDRALKRTRPSSHTASTKQVDGALRCCALRQHGRPLLSPPLLGMCLIIAAPCVTRALPRTAACSDFLFAQSNLLGGL
mmetsp:Transcript_25603/g.72046  ORF Transcript_25603/g.72046 Transcript_25603/m.72046 type:complete len:180 (-) Transcript_25603:936-1475(-)|eukprot:scaffold104738_cov33-Tisochrysis_lutea.AAC.5